MSDDLYIGYIDRAPGKVARSIVAITIVLLLVSAAIGVILVRSQDPFAEATFEYGTLLSYTGWMETGALPTLTVLSDAGEIEAKYLLVLEGKHGGPAASGRAYVRLRGTLIHRDGVRMLEIADGSIEPAPGPASSPSGRTKFLGVVTLRGEIVDSKCFLGVMKPGEKTVHRACARLCIRGGIPPILVVRVPDGGTEKIFLTNDEGEAVNLDVLPFVATPVSVSGSLYNIDGLLVMRIDVASLTLLD